MNPEISVVMANYNGARHLGAAIESLQRQTFSSWELLFADDGSKDESVALASRLAQKDPRIRVLGLEGNRGPAAARNAALDCATGRWIAVFDSDDLMRPSRLQALHERAHADRAGIVADNLVVFSSSRPKGRHFLPRRYAKAPRWIGLAEYIDSGRLYSRDPDLGYLKPFIARDLLCASGVRYNEGLRIGEDSELMARLLAAGSRLRLVPEAYYMYRKHEGSISHRIQRDAILRLIETNSALAEQLNGECGDALAALRRRDASLRSMLLYDHVITLLKRGEYGRAALTGLGAPHIWPMLTRPLTARISRLAEKCTRPILQAGAMPQTVD